MRLKILNGAPLCAQLDFDEAALLDPEDRDGEHGEFLRGVLATRSSEEVQDPAHVKWRRITSACLRTSWSQPHLPANDTYKENPEFSFSAPILEPSFDSVEQHSHFDETTLPLDDSAVGGAGFLQHSLLLHDTLLSSQIALEAGVGTITSPSFISTSFDSATTETNSSVNGEIPAAILHLPSNLTIASLNSLPSANYLRSIYPQTPTRNLVCVLTSPPEHKEVLVRKGNYKMHIYETVVADDTKTGFKVSFWFRPPNDGDRARDPQQESLRETLERARVGDIFLLRNVVLNVFRDNVYGQSLNPTIARARTTAEVLRRGDGVATIRRGALPTAIVEAFVRVKRWANEHVASNSRKRRVTVGRKERRSKRLLEGSTPSNEDLPPDTLEA